MKINFSYNQKVDLKLLIESIKSNLGETDKISVLLSPNLPHDEEKVTLTKYNTSKIIHDLFPEENPQYINFIVEDNKIHEKKIQIAGLKYKALESKKERDEYKGKAKLKNKLNLFVRNNPRKKSCL